MGFINEGLPRATPGYIKSQLSSTIAQVESQNIPIVRVRVNHPFFSLRARPGIEVNSQTLEMLGLEGLTHPRSYIGLLGFLGSQPLNHREIYIVQGLVDEGNQSRVNANQSFLALLTQFVWFFSSLHGIVQSSQK